MFLFVSSHADVHAKSTLVSERAPMCRMKVPLGLVVTAAGICGTLSFVFLATSLGTDYWYIIEVNPAMNMSDLNSHSGLWSVHEGAKPMLMFFYFTIKHRRVCFFFVMEILTVVSRRDHAHGLHRLFHSGLLQVHRGWAAHAAWVPAALVHSLVMGVTVKTAITRVRVCTRAGMHRTIVVLLPLSLVLLLIGGICGLVSSLAQSQALLTGTASYFFICSENTLSMPSPACVCVCVCNRYIHNIFPSSERRRWVSLPVHCYCLGNHWILNGVFIENTKVREWERWFPSSRFLTHSAHF